MSAFALCRDARGDAAVRATLERRLSLERGLQQTWAWFDGDVTRAGAVA